jgi:translation elongation factor P/translation initiation factor 5A
MEKVNQNVVLKKETIKASELKKNDMCIIQDKIYKITAIWFAPTLETIGLQHKFRFILYCEEDKSKIERIYPVDFQLELDMNSYVEMEI